MKRILSFLAGKQFRETVLRESDERYKMITYLLVILIGSFCIGFFLASYYDFSVKENVVSVDKLLIFVNSFFAINFLLLDFYPVYKINPFLFPSYYPIGKYRKAQIVLFIYSINYFSLFVLLTYIQFTIFSLYFSTVKLLFSLIFVYCGYLLNRIVKNITEYSVPDSKVILLVIFVSTAGYVGYLFYFPSQTLVGNILLVFFVGILFMCFANSESEKKVIVKRNVRLPRLIKNFFSNILLNKNLSTTYTYGFFFKALWLIVAGLNMTQDGGTEQVSAATWQFASPLIIFLYTGINFFGYSKNLFFTNALRETNIKNLSLVYFKSMGILLLIDGLIFWLFLWATDLIQWEHVLFYYTSTIVLLVTSFWFAVYRPSFADNFLFFDFSLLKNRGRDFNLWGVAALVAISFVIDRVRYSDYKLAISAILIVSSVISFYVHRCDFSSITQYAYRKLRNI